MRFRCLSERPADGFYERPAQFVRGHDGHVLDVVPRQLIRLCRTHVQAGDKLVQRTPGGRCGFSFNAPPATGVRFAPRRRKAKR